MALDQILHCMLREAERLEGKPSVTHLPKGLRIQLAVGKDQTVLRLVREGVYPSLEEFKTVAKFFPYPIGAVRPHQQKLGKEFHLLASWPTQPRIFGGGG